MIAFEAFFNTWKSFHFSVSLIHLAESKDTWNEIKLAGIKDYFQKQYPGLEIHYDVVMNDNLLKGLDKYIKDNQIDIITLTSYKRNIFARLFNPSIARKMIFHSDTPLLVINGVGERKTKISCLHLINNYDILCLIKNWYIPYFFIVSCDFRVSEHHPVQP